MPKIFTVTANTAIDQVITVDDFILGDTLVASNSVQFAAGKGINVAKALMSLEQPVIALGFVGQQSRADFEGLQSALLKTAFTWVKGKTRTNITLINANSSQETHIRAIGYSVNAADCQQLIAKLKAKIQAGDIVVLSGSIPDGAPIDFYKSLIELCHAYGALVFLDSSGEPLKAGLSGRPYLIKPNHHELEVLIGQSLKNEQAIIQAAQAIVNKGVKCVVVSRGNKGALLVTENQVLSTAVANTMGNIISSIGCGDAMVAGLALSKIQGDDFKASLLLALACGTANLFTAEPGRFDKNILENIRNKFSFD
ncbi:MAG: 1-phosphofructokinase family hexose kinase [Methylococcaceae bacterium]|nr:1-phosphofructokinase family hexose kinase [Methylococcaceae bacterium]